jgi:hypothetical protein
VYAANRRIGIHGRGDGGVGFREIHARRAVGSLEDRVDDVGAAALLHRLHVAPVRGDHLHRHPGLLLPQAPQVDRVAFQFAIGITQDERRVVLVHDHAQRRRRRCRRKRGQQQAGKQQ